MEEIIETNYVILNKLDVCKSSEKSDKNLLIAIKTAPVNREQRDIVRKTWLIEVMEHRVPYIFVIGDTTDPQLMEELLMEDRTHNDLLIGKPVDNYYNLTLKGIFLLAWANNYCSTRWLLYMDDDSIINIQKAIDFVASVNNVTNRALYGHILHPLVHRNQKSKWYVPVSIWKPKYYPPYCYGNGFIISPNILPLLHQAATNISTKPKLWIDDVYITGIVTKAVGIKLIAAPFQCTASGNIKLFNQSILLGQMGKQEKLLMHWKTIRGNLTDDRQTSIKVLTSMSKISQFHRQGHLLTKRTQISEKLFAFNIKQYFPHTIDYSLLLGIAFLVIMTLLIFNKCPSQITTVTLR